jgi:hypothetical protein
MEIHPTPVPKFPLSRESPMQGACAPTNESIAAKPKNIVQEDRLIPVWLWFCAAKQNPQHIGNTAICNSYMLYICLTFLGMTFIKHGGIQ